MSFVNAPGDERGTEFSQNKSEHAEVPVHTTTPRKKKKGKKGSNLGTSSGTKKKKKRKRASPKKSNNPNLEESTLEESNEEVMTKLMAVKQLKQQPMLIGKTIFYVIQNFIENLILLNFCFLYSSHVHNPCSQAILNLLTPNNLDYGV